MKVAVIMGSSSDWEIMSESCTMLEQFEIPYEKKVVSAHRTPHLMVDFASHACNNGYDLIIAGAGGAAHLPGMVASMTTLPVIGVPIESKSLKGWIHCCQLFRCQAEFQSRQQLLVKQVPKCRYTSCKNIRY